MPDFKIAVRTLVGEAKLEEALALAKQEALQEVTVLDTPITLLQSEWEYLKQKINRGLLTLDEESARRQQIVLRLLDLIDELPASTSPVVQAATTASPKEVILFMGANPFQHLALQLDREVQEISRGLERFGKRQAFDFRAKVHVTPVDLQRMLLETEVEPRFVHFAGNAVVDHPAFGSGVIFEDENGKPRTVPGAVLATVFKQFPSVECVVLNTCDSGPSALAIGSQVPYVVGMNARIYDESAIVFAVAFYEAIADGNPIPFAFEFAKSRLLLEQYPEQAEIPVLIVNGKCDQPVYVEGESHIVDPSPRLPR